MKRAHAMPFGAAPGPEGVRFRLWAPGAPAAPSSNSAIQHTRRPLPMLAAGEGWFEVVTQQAGPGTRYRYRIDNELAVPDPASRFNPGDVHGASAVVEPRAFDWSDGAG